MAAMGSVGITPPAEYNSTITSSTISSKSSVQRMTIRTEKGHYAQIPVDVQAESLVPGQRKRRNTGAVARFRARRTEKERSGHKMLPPLRQLSSTPPLPSSRRRDESSEFIVEAQAEFTEEGLRQNTGSPTPYHQAGKEKEREASMSTSSHIPNNVNIASRTAQVRVHGSHGTWSQRQQFQSELGQRQRLTSLSSSYLDSPQGFVSQAEHIMGRNQSDSTQKPLIPFETRPPTPSSTNKARLINVKRSTGTSEGLPVMNMKIRTGTAVMDMASSEAPLENQHAGDTGTMTEERVLNRPEQVMTSPKERWSAARDGYNLQPPSFAERRQRSRGISTPALEMGRKRTRVVDDEDLTQKLPDHKLSLPIGHFDYTISEDRTKSSVQRKSCFQALRGNFNSVTKPIKRAKSIKVTDEPRNNFTQPLLGVPSGEVVDWPDIQLKTQRVREYSTATSSTRGKRGSLYESDVQHHRNRRYTVEVREQIARDLREHLSSGYYR